MDWITTRTSSSTGVAADRAGADPVGVVPAAGHGTRLGRLETSKETIHVGGKPVLAYVVERMWAAGPREIRVVTRPEKRDVAEEAERLGATVVTGRPSCVADSLLLGLSGLADGDEVLFGFPDTIWEPHDGFVLVLRELRRSADTAVVLGLFTTPDLTRSDVVESASDGSVRAIHVKPHAPRSARVWGCLAARAGVLRGIEGHDEPGRWLHDLAREGSVRGIELGAFRDIGTPEALRDVVEST